MKTGSPLSNLGVNIFKLNKKSRLTIFILYTDFLFLLSLLSLLRNICSWWKTWKTEEPKEEKNNSSVSEITILQFLILLVTFLTDGPVSIYLYHYIYFKNKSLKGYIFHLSHFLFIEI